MIEINIEDKISHNLISHASEEEAEKIINAVITEALTQKIDEALHKMAYIDIEFNEEEEAFNLSATLVLCSAQDVASTAEIQAQKLAKYGLSEEEILDVLSTGIESMGGF